jgi:1,4-dihydroxy-2-naphthoyl-CoA synthase
LRLQFTLGFRFNLGFGFRLGVKLGFDFGFGFGFVVKLGFAVYVGGGDFPCLVTERNLAHVTNYGTRSEVEAKITVERRGQTVLIGVNRPQTYNRFDPDAFFGLAKAYYDFDNDPSLRAAVFFGHGENFSGPLIAVVHGDTWNMGHELHLVADIRIASAGVRFGQDENTHGRFPGGGSTIRPPVYHGK